MFLILFLVFQGLMTEGIKCEVITQSVSLPTESGPYQVKVTLCPKEAGSLGVLGKFCDILFIFLMNVR